MRKLDKKLMVKLFLAPILMFGFAYSLIPLYDVLCDITGIAGRTGRINTVSNDVVDLNRKVRVEFLSMTTTGFDVNFEPEVTSMDVVPGKLYGVNYIAENRTGETIIGQAIPSVTPPEAALNFNKLECFCFNKQVFKPGDKISMPVRFVVEAKLPGKVKDISLLYNFFRLEEEQES